MRLKDKVSEKERITSICISSWKTHNSAQTAQYGLANIFKLEKFTMLTILHFHLQLQFKYKLFHIHFTSFHCKGKYEPSKLT